MIEVTEKAINQIKQILKNEGKEDHGLRIGVRSGGCSGLSYYMEIVKEPIQNDHIVEKDGVKFFIDVFSAMYLQGTTLDFTDGLNGSGFVFNNPNAVRTCGCGQSFTA